MREGTSWQGDMVTRGSEGRDAVAPLPNKKLINSLTKIKFSVVHTWVRLLDS